MLAVALFFPTYWLFVLFCMFHSYVIHTYTYILGDPVMCHPNLFTHRACQENWATHSFQLSSLQELPLTKESHLTQRLAFSPE